ncbi:hypothetical protein IVB41_05775 [Bradyrhizobium sp. 44]|uniref:hypothetical protein n=1 Tax=Bradyrhizobium sp. 44 TaxID=2782675 RepID=UPI001FFAA3F1|nr:hypothetical protein [Bradyrhizobium sp. 44]MCK1283443.1 hypothetical protein [Bradyrhizobium sp. 44]
MSKAAYQPQVDKLLAAIGAHVNSAGVKLGVAHHDAISPILHWIDYLKGSELTGCCDDMLDGIRATAVEASGCIALGLIRPALFALRAQIDATIAWLFFKDHPIEWEFLLRTGDGFKSRNETIEFFGRYVERFTARFQILTAHRTRSVEQPYRLLSAHIHGQSALVVPTFQNLAAMVYPKGQCEEAIKIQADVVEYIGDIFLSYYASKWPALPDSILSAAKARVPNEKHSSLFS